MSDPGPTRYTTCPASDLRPGDVVIGLVVKGELVPFTWGNPWTVVRHTPERRVECRASSGYGGWGPVVQNVFLRSDFAAVSAFAGRGP